ncbi:hypothetical protein ELI43_06830 [Rhizobium leguminosarum]|uniref:hypothetical protein n=1 Tax=Rhizobium leguminosarum TaxID=384 RepID=UPI00102FAA29|nr:hypothetical protein [Rhizobium leguminosarum]TAU52544.1 hypothetical protein ELI43_06830 [Rhizobium leguminosarum]
MEIQDDEAEISFRDWNVVDLTQRIQANCFVGCPALIGPCAAFIFERGGDQRPSTRDKYRKMFGYLSRYIEAYGASYGIRITEYSDFSTLFMKGFLAWLQGKGDVVPRVNHTGGLSKISAAGIHNLVRDLIRFIKDSEEFSHLAPQTIVFEANPSRRGHKDIKQRPGLREAELRAIRRACFTELEETFEALNEGLDWIQDSSISIPDLRSPAKAFSAFKTCVKAYLATENLKLSTEAFRARFPGLHRALHGPPYHTIGDVLRRIHFTKRSIVPVVLLLAMHFAFEPDTLMQLDWKRDGDSFLYGASRGVLTGEKYRGGFSLKSKPYVRNDKRKFSPGALIKILRTVSGRTAELISRNCSRMFCFAKRDGSLGYFKDSEQFLKVLKMFIEKHDLPHFTLSHFRKTGADIVAKVTGDDLAEQKAFLRQKTVATTAKHYQSTSSIERREEQLAHAQNIRTRRVETDGRIETRGASLTGGQRLAATVGFYCLDPYDSPQPDQVQGELCKAYGKCPACPLAQIDRDSPRDFCRLKQVRGRLLEARADCSPSRWQLHWQPQLEALDDTWLPVFTENAKLQAQSLMLPSIPEIE